MRTKVELFCNESHFFEETETVVVATSGGADSMALLHILHEMQSAYHYQLVCVHVNHMARGAESDGDEGFVSRFCEEKGISFFSFRAPIEKLAKEAHISFETFAREYRYARFTEVAKRYTNAKIATGHTADDHAETVLHRMVRGTGLHGLAGIPKQRKNIIRPLLTATRAEILAYLEENQQPYREDSTNALPIYTRNRFRLQVFPLLKEENPRVTDALLGLSEEAAEVEDFLLEEVQKLLAIKTNQGYDVSQFEKAHTAVRKKALWYILTQAGISPNRASVDRVEAGILTNSHFSENVKGALFLCREEGSYFLVERKKEQINSVFYEVGTGICCKCGEKRVEINTIATNVPQNFKKVHDSRFSNIVFYDRMDGRLVLRTRQSGDTVFLIRRKITKSLKKYMQEEIPKEERDKRLLLAQNNRILWIEGIGSAPFCSQSENVDESLCACEIRMVEKGD